MSAIRRRRVDAVFVIVLSTAALSGIAGAQTYGPKDQVLTIDSLEFLPVNPSFASDYAPSTNYLGGNGAGGSYRAPVHLPDGAEITQMCLYYYDPNSTGTDATIEAMKLPAGGQEAGLVVVHGSSVFEYVNIGYGTVCTDPMSFTIHSDADLDGMGSRHLAYFIYAETHAATRIGGVRIAWHRQISPPPLSPTFADVPNGAFAYAGIEALAASGITQGCGNGNFCPNQTLTRAQMAALLARALGLYWGN
jgi:hypothetical protein